MILSLVTKRFSGRVELSKQSPSLNCHHCVLSLMLDCVVDMSPYMMSFNVVIVDVVLDVGVGVVHNDGCFCLSLSQILDSELKLVN